jgi:probable sporulation protein (polysaccharide deacetylase family)
MKVIFLDKKKWIRAGIWIFLICLIVCGAILVLPRSETTGADLEAPQPYRSGDPESSCISLAINVDWGEEFIPDLLQVLADNGVSATFFLTGRWCDLNPDLAADIAAAGHELGNHGYSHKSPNASSREAIIDEIQRTEAAIEKATGIVTRLYAPPSGEEEPHVIAAAAEAGYDTILWSVDTIDWQKPDAATIIERVKNKIRGGAIILAHPTAATVEALKSLIKDLEEEGYAFVPVSVNLGL